jgi:hypothetical protein
MAITYREPQTFFNASHASPYPQPVSMPDGPRPLTRLSKLWGPKLLQGKQKALLVPRFRKQRRMACRKRPGQLTGGIPDFKAARAGLPFWLDRKGAAGSRPAAQQTETTPLPMKLKPSLRFCFFLYKGSLASMSFMLIPMVAVFSLTFPSASNYKLTLL